MYGEGGHHGKYLDSEDTIARGSAVFIAQTEEAVVAEYRSAPGLAGASCEHCRESCHHAESTTG